MKIQLLTHTPNPQQVVAAAAKLCYSAADIADLIAINGPDQQHIIKKVIGLGHFSVLEHVSFTFGIEGISRSCSHQLVRHRLASYSQQSQRYVAASGSNVVPPSIAGSQYVFAVGDLLNDIDNLYREMVDAGIPAEDARFILPNAAETKLVMTMNARELHHFFTLRCCRRSQWEIRAMAKQMLLLCRDASPLLFADAGPSCLRGKCQEGVMTCGKWNEVIEELKT